jgi:heptosyltransferase-2
MSQQYDKILVHAPTWIGDLVMATAAFHDLRQRFPESHITLLLRPGRDQVVNGADYFDDTICDRSSGSLKRVWNLASSLRKQRFDLAVLFADSLRSGLIPFLARIPHRVGYVRNLRGPLLTHPVRHAGERGAKTPEPMPLRFARMLEAIGVESLGHRPRLVVTEEEEEATRKRRQQLGIATDEQLIGFNPGASFGASKIWPPDRFARLGDLVQRKLGARVILLGGPGEKDILNAIADAMETDPINTGDDPIPLGELKPTIRDLALLVTTDTGPRHYGVAFRVPLVCLMGPTDPRYTNINLDETELIQKDHECMPCHLKTCPIDHRCMTSIEPEEVLERIGRLGERFGCLS